MPGCLPGIHITKLVTQVGPETGNHRFTDVLGKHLGQHSRGYGGMTATNYAFLLENLEKFPTDRAA
jgi:hypothetical protein